MKADELKQARSRKNMTQVAFAAWLGVKPRTVIAWENNQNPVPEVVAKRIKESELKLNPNLPFEVFQAAEQQAAAQGITLDEWVAQIMTSAVKAKDERSR